ncbi:MULTISPECIES: hypothetical protein [Acidobacteriaceae]|uniref:hypothetical protein n=1 Tax=Acidobacteriaceae TaxID=204434 RepID=UPI00131D3DB0|nr:MULTISPECIES: hypothetical protein [Acidobacteriaceae]MDW5267709.1 hypothetical protein [Edaphobacter sp.]
MPLSKFTVDRIIATAMAFFCVAPAFAQVNVVMQHNDHARTGTNLRETVLTPDKVNKEHFGMLFKHVVDDQVYTQPLVLTNVPIRGGWHTVVYITTVNNSVYAFDANDATAKEAFWHVNFGTPASLHDHDFGCLDINGNMGIIGTPVIDAKKGILYVVALTKVTGHFEQRLHALDVSTGADLPNSPKVIEAPDFDPLMENQRPGLMLDHGNIYIGYSSHCDKLPYHGFLLSYDASTLSQIGALNLSPGGDGASIWQSGQAPAIDSKGDIYFSTGNGSWNGTTQFSETFMHVTPEMKMLDWFTPSNHVQLDKDDNDVDSSGVTLIPGTHLMVGGGKQGVLYVLDTEKMGQLGDEHAIQHFQATSSHIHSLVYWHSDKNGKLLYVWGQKDRERVYKFEGDKLEETPFMTRPEMNHGHPGGMLSLSANGGKGGILWAAIHLSGDSWHESRPVILHAFDADDVNRELWNSREVPERDDCAEYSKMAPPTIANGRVYLASFGTENTGTGQFCVYGLLPNGAPPPAPTALHASIDQRAVAITWVPVPGAEYYALESTQGGTWHIIASGLTRNGFIEAADIKGSTEYKVIAFNANGHGAFSDPSTVVINDVPVPRSMPMH